MERGKGTRNGKGKGKAGRERENKKYMKGVGDGKARG